MPVPQPELDPSPWRTAWEWFSGVLTNDPTLARVVSTWRVWDGSGNDAEEPTVKQMPWVRLAPRAELTQPEAVLLSTSGMAVDFDVALAGTRGVDLMDMAWAVVKAALPDDLTARLQIEQDAKGVGVYSVKLIQPAFTVTQLPDGAKALYASGTFLLKMQIKT
jgi:hypothetical protein